MTSTWPTLSGCAFGEFPSNLIKALGLLARLAAACTQDRAELSSYAMGRIYPFPKLMVKPYSLLVMVLGDEAIGDWS